MSRKINKEGAMDFTRRRFWSHGYSVKTMPGVADYDLLVDGDKRVLVIPGSPTGESGGDKSGIFDMVAYVVRDKHSGANVIYFEVPGHDGVTVNPKEAVAEVDIIKNNSSIKTHEKSSGKRT